jgi:uncharacterized protein YqeY
MNERIKLDLIEAMKSKEELRLSTIRLLKGAIEIEEKKIKKSLEDSEILDIISKQVKLRKESIIEFEKANRLDAVDKLNKELDILYDYLPEQLSTNELLILIDEAIKEVNATSSKDFGNVMKIVVPKIKGKADSKEVSEIIKNKLQ